ncbi:hypothetical protein XU18_0369 [Perkinsela sp. CCAP 1560/4]|nr:hypothetical protein XU18_0369 [Perkinsela sp. CCAP 1560/4]|eukprot:KNH09684.1 hypothetical protein XU18_0369 [Perkinsela sp. CCAP 1560/4]
MATDLASLIRSESAKQNSLYVDTLFSSKSTVHCTSPDVTLYRFSAKSNEWQYEDIRGCLFFVTDSQGNKSLILLNRSSTAYNSFILVPLLVNMRKAEWQVENRKNLMIKTGNKEEILNFYFASSIDSRKFAIFLRNIL